MAFQDLLFKIDLLGIPVTMNLFGREKAKTRLGGFFSFLFLGFVGWAIYNAGYELFRTTDPALISYEYYRDDPRAITLSRESFPIGFVMQAPTSMNNIAFKDESIFKIDVTHTMARKTVDATGATRQIWTTSKVYLENCTSDYFGELASGFQSMSLGNSYCISETQPELDKIEIQGVYSSPIYQTVTVQISVCDNTTSVIPCAPEETINEYLSGSWFNAMYVNMVVNPQNYTHPNNTYKDFYYTMISPANYRETEISLSYVQIDTDSGWLTPTTNTKTYTQVNKIAEFLQTNSDPNGILILCTFKVSQLEQYYTRSYKKLQSVLAEVAGIANSVLVILIFAGYPFMKMKFRESLMNELFDIRLPKPQKNRRKSRQTPQKTVKSGEESNIDIPAKLTFSPLKSDAGINLMSFPDYKELDTPYLISPINSEGRRLQDLDHSKKRGLFLTPQQSSSFILQLPISPQNQKANSDSELASNKIEAKPCGHPKTCQELGEKKLNKLINEHVFSTRGSEAENLEEKIRKINRIQSELKSSDHKPILISKSKTAQPKMKSLHDENSLHLSFSSNEDGSDHESGGRKENTNQFEMLNLNLEKVEKKASENFQGIEEVMSPVSRDASPTRRVNGHFGQQDPGVKKRLDTGLCEYLSWLVKPNRNKYKQAFTEGFKQMDRRLDIINILKKLREVDKLTTLILDPDQLILFNNLPKPVIQLKNHQLERRRSESRARLENLQFVPEETSEERIMDSLNTLKNKAVKSKMDKKLIDMFENESYS